MLREMTQPLVLSLFPGIGMLDHAFELEGFCVVRGPDIIWGGDIHAFNPPAGRFDGVIGGPPCQAFSPLGNVNRARYGDASVMPDLIPEFARVIELAAPSWFVMENSPQAYEPAVSGYSVVRRDLENGWLGEDQARRRAFWFGCDSGESSRWHISTPALALEATESAVCSKGSADWKGSRKRGGNRSLEDMLELQGFPRDWMSRQPFTKESARRMVGNGVSLAMGLAVARAVSRWSEGKVAA